VDTLPQKHSALWDVFKTVKNKRDQEAYELLLADEALRIRFYERFAGFARTLGIALSTVTFLEQTPEKKVAEYKRDLKFFTELRRSVRRRYAEVVDFSEYEVKVRKLLDTYLGAEEVEQIVRPVDLFNKEEREKVLAQTTGAAAKADVIAHNVKRTIEVKWQEDPAFYKKFSKMLEDVIDAFHAGRLKAVEYLKKATDIMGSVLNRTGDDVPEELAEYEVAKAFYGAVHETLAPYGKAISSLGRAETEASLGIDEIIRKRRIVNWTTNPDVQNQMRTEIEDYLFDLKERHGVELTFEDIDTIMDQCLEIAKVRYP